MKFENRTAFITGAAGRIGRATAEEFGKYGVKLYLADIRPEPLEEFAGQLRAKGIDAHAVPLDVTDSDQIEKTAQAVIREAGKVDILVNNAGQWPLGTMLETEDEVWQQTIDLNLTSVFRLSKAFAAGMKEKHYGRIVNFASIAGEVGLPGFCAYSAAKAGVIMLTKTAAMELAASGVTVNSVSPGMIQNEKTPSDSTWVGRTGTGDEIARAIVFLASDDASYITGADLPVDGGRILGPKTTRKL